MLIWFLPAVIIFGFITSYIDVKEGKIKNSHIILALAYSFIVYSILIFSNLGTVRAGYFVELLITCLLSLIAGFVIWYVGLWTAGDAKLFFAYSLLIPLSVYKYGYIPYFSSMNLLINTFVPMFIFLFTYTMVKTNAQQKLIDLKSSFSPKQLLNLAVYLFALTWLIELILPLFNIPPTYVLNIFIVFLLLMTLERLFSVNITKILIIVSITRLIFDTNIYSSSFAYKFLLTLIIFIFFRFFASMLSFDVFTKKIKISLLKPGMVPAEIIIQEGDKYKKQRVSYYALFSLLQQKTNKKQIIELTAEGLTRENVETLKKLERKLGFESLVIQTTVPFAPFMFAGALLTILFEGNMFFSSIAILKSIFF